MKVKCPECGKIFEIKKEQSQRLLKCQCKALFRPTPGREIKNEEAVSVEKLSEEVAEVSEAPEKPRDDESQIRIANKELEEYESNISDDDMNSYLSNLKASRDQLAKEDADIRPIPQKNVNAVSMRLELVENAKKKEKSTMDELMSMDEALQNDETMETRHPAEMADEGEIFRESYIDPSLQKESLASASPKTKKVVERATPNISPKVQMIALCGALTFCGFIGYFIAEALRVKIEPQDPYLTKLLTPPPEAPIPSLDEPQKIEAEKISPHREPTPVAQADPLSTGAPTLAPTPQVKVAPHTKTNSKTVKKTTKRRNGKSESDAEVHLSAGIMMLNSSPRKAAKEFEAALNLSPNNSEVWMNYGYALYKMKKFQAALGALQRSLALQETDQVHYFLALTLLDLNRRSEAIQHVKRATKLNPRNSQARNLASRLR